MNWIRRYTVQIFSLAFVYAFGLIAVFPHGASAAQSGQPAFWFSGRRVPIAQAIAQRNDYAVSINDPALKELLNELGAYVTWQSGERYVLITTAQPTVISFALGDTRYDVGPITSSAAFAPFMQNGQAYIPFYELLRALSLEPKRDDETIVLQPQLSKISVKSSGGRATLSAVAAVPLKLRQISDSPEKLVVEFDGVGSTLERSRGVSAAGLRAIGVETVGTVRSPKTILTLFLAAGGSHDAPRTTERGFSIGFSGSRDLAPNSAPVAVATSAPTPEPSATQSQAAAPTQLAPITGVQASTSANGANVSIAITGNATYEWHRLGEPDNRFWVDIHGARLQGAPPQGAQAEPVLSIRARQTDADTVRIALT
ncbi:MAG: AMIN domain-containing protein, partial [Candidatus Eremiobacteraeota bacterium]|nr:AMIN domain-containing protein [Candidatus Eremiobacteraeota bacterium]